MLNLYIYVGMEVKPCNGETPLTDPDGREYDCGSGLHRKDCPSNSYCHQTPRFARCCKKGMYWAIPAEHKEKKIY